MPYRSSPIQQKLMRAILLTCAAVLILTCASFFAIEFVSYRQNSIRELTTLGQIIATNSTAALAFNDTDAGTEILAALKAERQIVGACLYDDKGNIFSQYPASASSSKFPPSPQTDQFIFEKYHLNGFLPVIHGKKRLGTLYLKSDMGAMYNRLKLYGAIATAVIIVSLLFAFFLSRRLQKGISSPILNLAETARAVSDRQDYSVRAVKHDDDELGLLTDAFNHMLAQIQLQNAALSKNEAELEQKVTERTQELEAVNKELESFSYSISHDLRAPLRSIHGYMNILAEEYEDKFDDEAKRLVNIILRNGQKMGQLIDDLLSFSRLGRKELTKSMVSMNEMVVPILEDYKKLEVGHAFDIKLSKLPSARVDASTIRQVWVNLISNAIKYSRRKEKTIIEIGSFEENGSLVYFVRDNGAGFDMRYYDKLFGVFQRLHSEKEFEGTGVGLAIVQRIVSKHGGKVWAEAKVNEGAVFYFSITK